MIERVLLTLKSPRTAKRDFPKGTSPDDASSGLNLQGVNRQCEADLTDAVPSVIRDGEQFSTHLPA